MSKVYEAVAQAGQPVTLPRPWHDVSCDPAFLRLPREGAALLAQMRRQFSNEQLRDAGVVTVDAEGSLAPQLVAGEPIWVIRSAPDQPPTALIAQMTTLRTRQWAFATAWQEHRQRDLIAAASQSVVVAYTMEDLAILRSIGLPAVPGSDWSQLTRRQLDTFCQLLRITRRGAALPTSDAQTAHLSLTLANWSLAHLDRAGVAAATASWSHLVELCRHLNLPQDPFGLWKPSAPQLQQLGLQLRYEHISQVRAGLLHGIHEHSRAIDADLHPLRAPPATIAAAHRAWRQAEQLSLNSYARQSTFKQLAEILERQRYEPLMAEGQRASCPLLRNALLALAEVSRLHHLQLLQLTEQVRRRVGEQAGNIIPQEEFGQTLALTDRVLTLIKEVQACRRHRPPSKIKSQQPAARSRPSASRPK